MRNSKVKLLLILGIFVSLNLYTNIVKAQYYSDEPTFFGGFVLGANFAQVDGDNFAGYRKIGLNGGAMVHTRLADDFTLSMELLYAEKGSVAGKGQLPKRSATNPSVLINEYDIRMRTAEVSLGVNYFFKDKKSILHLGLAPNYMVDATSTVNGVETIDLYPFKKFGLDGYVGASYRMYKRFYIDTKYQISVLNIRKIHDPSVERPQQTSRLLTLRLLYLMKDYE